MRIPKLFFRAVVSVLIGAACIASVSAYGQTPLPVVADRNLQQCLLDQAALNGWQYAEQVTQLDCPGRGLADLEGLEALPAIAKLNLADNAITNIGPLYAIKTLTSLNLSGNTGISIYQLSSVLEMNYGLTRLGLNGIRVGSIANLGALASPITGEPRSFVELDLGNTSISEFANAGIDFILSSPNLERLNLAGNGISNIQAFSYQSFSRLTELDLANNAITDVGSLGSLRSLTRLNLSGNTGIDIYQLRPVLDLNYGLTRLGLNGIRVGSIANLGSAGDPMTGQLRNYVELDLGNTSISELANAGIDFIQSFPNLERLNLAGNGISNIQVFSRQSFSRLVDLDLANNAITTDVGLLGSLRSLTRLNLSGNTGIDIYQLRPALDLNYGLTRLGLNGIRVGSIANLGALTNPMTGQPRNYVELDLGNTSIIEFANAGIDNFIRNFPNLERLNLAGNGISHIQVFSYQNFSRLADLDLANNAITDVGPLDRTHSLARLNLSGNTGVDIQQLRYVLDMNPGLTRLGLNGIQVGSIVNLGSPINPMTGQPRNFVELDLGNTGISEFANTGIDFIQSFPNLERLNLAGNGISNIRAFAYQNFSRLAELDLANNAITDVGPLGSLRSLTRLNLSGNTGVDSQQLPLVLDMNYGLTRLSLNGIRVGSIANLGALTNPMTGQPRNYVELDLGNTSISEFANAGVDFIRSFPNLERLNLAGNGISNIQAFWYQNFSRLTDLDLANNAITDVGWLGSLRSLTRLNLSGNTAVDSQQLPFVLDMNYGLTRLGLNGIRVGSIANLGALTNPMTGQPRNYVELDLGNTSISEFANVGVDFIQRFPNLERLNLANSAITNIGPLTSLRKLTSLNLSGNTDIDIYQLRPVLDMNPGITRLGLNGIRVGTLGNLGSLTNPMTGQPRNYVELDLGNTSISEFANYGVDFIQGSPNLERLNLAGNGISNIQAFSNQNFPRLADLDLANNSITDVGPLGRLTRLTRLNLSGNTGIDIQQLRPVLDMNPGVTRLGLNGIRVGSIANLGSLINPMTGLPRDFVELDLGNTSISEFANDGIDFIQGFPNLQRLNLAGNGISNIQAFFRQSFSRLVDLDLAKNAIADVVPLMTLSSLSHINLLGNNQIWCIALDNLAQRFPLATIQRPIPCASPNVPPIAGVGADQIVNEGSAVILSGSGKDLDGTIVSFQWTQTGGPAVTLVNANSPAASFTAPKVTADTALTFQLTVTDNVGATATASTKVTVQNVSGADLVVTALSGSVTSIKRGSSFSFSVTTANVGDRTTLPTNTCLYLSADTTITTSDVPLQNVTLASLGPGVSLRRTGLAKVPSTLAPGTYYLGAIADCALRQSEIDERNNSRTGARIVVTQ